MKLMKTILKKPMEGISPEMWCSNWETRRFNEKLGLPGKPGELAGMNYMYL